MQKPATLILLFAFITALSVASYSEGGQEPVFDSQLIFEPGSAGFESCHGSTLAELKGGDIIAAWYGGSHEKAKDVGIYAARLKKGTTEWSGPWVIHDVPGKSEGNPVLWVDGGGVLWLFYVTIMKDNWNEARLFYKKSRDEGRTWSEPVVMLKPLGWMTRNKPIVLDNGDILLPIYNEILFHSIFLISSDGGETWKKSKKIQAPGGNIQASAVQFPDGTLLAGMRTGSQNGLLWWTRSKSRGKKWSKPFTTDVKNPGSGTDMVILENGVVALAFNDSSTSRNPMNVALSEDKGKTWPFNRIVESDDKGGSYSYPAIIVDSYGVMHLTYTFRRESIKHVALNEAWLKEKAK